MEKKFRCLGKRMKRLSSHGDGVLILTYVHLFYFVKGGSGVVGNHIFSICAIIQLKVRTSQMNLLVKSIELS